MFRTDDRLKRSRRDVVVGRREHEALGQLAEMERFSNLLLIRTSVVATAHVSAFRIFSLAVSVILYKIITGFAFYSYNLFPCLIHTKSVGSSQT